MISRKPARDDPAPGIPDYFAGLYLRSGAAGFDIPFDRFAALLLSIGAQQTHPADGRSSGHEFYVNLQLEDLALAHACAAGHPQAWERFIGKYEAVLQAASSAYCRDEGGAREAVNTLIGDLYGTGVDRDGNRRSKLASYTGRGTLAGWLKATLAQTCIDQYRLGRRFISLEEALPAIGGLCASDAAGAADVRLGPAVEEALRGLAPESRLLIKAHFLDGMTLAQIGEVLGVHESTVSRRLGKLVLRLRRSVLKLLRSQGMSIAAAKLALESDVRRVPADIRGTLLQSAQPIQDV